MKSNINTEEFLNKILRITTVAGRNKNAADELCALLPSGSFDSVTTDRAGNIILTKKSLRDGAPLLCIDAHFDQIGLIVRSIEEGGFVGVAPAGGLDARTLPAQQVTIHGCEAVGGVIISTPPHLRRRSDGDALTPIEDLLIDTGYSKEELSDKISIGDAISFDFKFGRLANDRVFGAGLDNKSCAAAAILGALSLDREEMACDLAILLSSAEEMGGFHGANAGFELIRPDIAIVLDVEFADCEDATYRGLPKLGGGPVIAHSALCDRHLVKHITDIAKKNEIPFTPLAWGTSLGTNGDIASTCACGISVASLSLPLTSMHTCVESVSLQDIDTLAHLLALIIKSDNLLKYTVVGKESGI